MDWKEDLVIHTVAGEEIRFNVYSATMGFSRKHVFIYSETKTEQDFIRCTNEMIKAFGGSTDEILTDNMSAIVPISGEGRRKHQNIIQWEKDAGIAIRLCRPRSPETKGKDESANRFINRLIPYDRCITSREDLIRAIAVIQNDSNDKVNEEIGMAPEALFQLKEKQALRALPRMSLLESYADGGETRKVPNTFLVPFQGRQYSVPSELIGKSVRVVRNGGNIDIYYSRKVVASHTAEGSSRISYSLGHYAAGLSAACGGKDLDELARKNVERFETHD